MVKTFLEKPQPHIATPSLAPAKSQLLPQWIYESMLRSIVTGEIAQGEFLSEIKLAQKFQTSRTPVREACIHLFKEGLLRVAPHKGYVVTEVSLDELRELYQLRQILEPEGAAMAASGDPPERFFTSCSAMLDEMALAAHRERSYEVFSKLSELEHAYHYAIAEASGNKKLAKFISELMNQFRRFYYSTFQKSPWLDSVVEEHRSILGAIQTHDAARARELMAKHIALGSKRASQILMSTVSASGSNRPHR